MSILCVTLDVRMGGIEAAVVYVCSRLQVVLRDSDPDVYHPNPDTYILKFMIKSQTCSVVPLHCVVVIHTCGGT